MTVAIGQSRWRIHNFHAGAQNRSRIEHYRESTNLCDDCAASHARILVDDWTSFLYSQLGIFIEIGDICPEKILLAKYIFLILILIFKHQHQQRVVRYADYRADFSILVSLVGETPKSPAENLGRDENAAMMQLQWLVPLTGEKKLKNRIESKMRNFPA